MMSEQLIDSLRIWGCDTEGAIRRLCGDKDFFLELFKEFFNEFDLSGLEKAISENDSKTAFSIAHSMKGITGNLGILPLYRPVCEITDIFRSGSVEGCDELFKKICMLKEELVEIFSSYD